MRVYCPYIYDLFIDMTPYNYDHVMSYVSHAVLNENTVTISNGNWILHASPDPKD